MTIAALSSPSLARPTPWMADTRAIWALAMVFPFILVFAIFVVYPVLYGFYLGLKPQAYIELFRDPVFFTALKNTAIFLLVGVNLKFLLALGLSGFFVVQRPMVKFVLLLFLLPWAMPSIPTILSLRLFLHPEWGILNAQIFQWTGQDGPPWLTDKHFAFAAAIFTHIWKSLPFWTLILITGRLAIPHELYEAAAVDGASRWQQFRHITWPSLAGLYITSTFLSMIRTLGDFNSVYLLTGGGPADQTHVLATLGVRYLRIDKLDLGIASIIVAMPFVLPLIIIMVRRLAQSDAEAKS